MAAPVGLEPTATRLMAECFNQLSYGAIFGDSSQIALRISWVATHYFAKESNGISARIRT